MNVKRYLAKDEQEAMQKIRYELGRDAVILHTRKIKQKGIKGWFSKPLVEVVAAVDSNEKSTSKGNASSKGVFTTTSNQAHSDYLREATQALLVERAKELERTRNQESDIAKQAIANVADNGNMKSELDEIKSQLSSLTAIVKKVVESSENQNKISPNTAVVQLHNPNDELSYQSPERIALSSDNHRELKDDFVELKSRLNLQRVSMPIIEKIISAIKRQGLNGESGPSINNVAKSTIKELLGQPYRIERKETGPQVYFFVGPTGVGKTTTLAKIAAKLSLIEGKKIGLITSDTYRISAVDQLKTYSEILNVPLEVIYEPDEISSVLNKFSDRDFILIDTAGRNHKSPELKADLCELLKYTSSAEVFLVISLTTSPDDIESIISSYDFIEKYELILTKLDEAAAYGTILNTKVTTNQLIAFLTNGQSVPDDIVIADPDKIASLLLGD